MLFSNPTSQGESKACSVGLSHGYKRVEQRLEDRSGYIWAIVQYRDVEQLFDFDKEAWGGPLYITSQDGCQTVRFFRFPSFRRSAKSR